MHTQHTEKHKNTAPRSGIINIRTTPKMRSLIDKAAASLGKTRTDFMLESAHKAAIDTILDQALFQVDAATFKKFTAALDAPPKTNEKLNALLKSKSPWD